MHVCVCGGGGSGETCWCSKHNRQTPSLITHNHLQHCQKKILNLLSTSPRTAVSIQMLSMLIMPILLNQSYWELCSLAWCEEKKCRPTCTFCCCCWHWYITGTAYFQWQKHATLHCRKCLLQRRQQTKTKLAEKMINTEMNVTLLNLRGFQNVYCSCLKKHTRWDCLSKYFFTFFFFFFFKDLECSQKPENRQMLDAPSKPWKSYQSKNKSIQVNVCVTINHFMHEEDWTKQKQNRGRSNKKHWRTQEAEITKKYFMAAWEAHNAIFWSTPGIRKGTFGSCQFSEDLNFSLWSSPTMEATEPSWQVKYGHCSQADWGIFGRSPAVWGIWGLQRALSSPGHLCLQEPKQSKYLLSEGPSSWDISGRAQTVHLWQSPSSPGYLWKSPSSLGYLWKSRSSPAHLCLEEPKWSGTSVWKSRSSPAHLGLEEPKQSGATLGERPSSLEHLCLEESPRRLIPLSGRAQAVRSVFVRQPKQSRASPSGREPKEADIFSGRGQAVWGIFARKRPSWVECLGLEEPECR